MATQPSSACSCIFCGASIPIEETVRSSMWHVINGTRHYREQDSALRQVAVAFYPTPLNQIERYAAAVQANAPIEPALSKWSISLTSAGKVPQDTFQKIAKDLTDLVTSRADDFRKRHLFIITRVAPG